MDPALLALLAVANVRIAQLMQRHIMAELNAEQALAETAVVVRDLMAGLEILDGDTATDTAA